MPIPTVAAQPHTIRALRRSIVAVGGAGLAAALLSTVGGGLMDMAASAAVSGGGAYGSGSSRTAVSGLSAGDAVPAAELPTHLDPSSLQGAVGETAASLSSVPAVVTEVVEGAAVAEALEVAAPPVAAPPVTTTTTVIVPQSVTPAPAPGTVQAVIHEVFGAHGAAAIGVARCESGLNPAAVSRGGGNWGLFQINKVHAKRVANLGYQWNDLLDPRVNAIVAKTIFDESGWRPWACRHAAH
jgi:soluble lytic murein transglycosylase-like protein